MAKEMIAKKHKAPEKLRFYVNESRYRELEQMNKDSANELKGFGDRINGGGFLTGDDLNSYRSAVDRYISSSEQMRSVAKHTGNAFSASDDFAWENTKKSLNTGYNEIWNHYAKWKDEDSFNLDMAAFKAQKPNPEAEKARNDKLNYNLEAGKKEIETLEDLYNNAFTIDLWYNEYQYRPDSYTKEEADRKLQIYNDLYNGYGSLNNLKSTISDKKKYLQEAQKLQNAAKLSGVSDIHSEHYNPDFFDKSKYVSTKRKGMLGETYDTDYEYINGAANGMRSEIARKNATFRKDTKSGRPKQWDSYDQMSRREIATYNYYYAIGGKEKADEYISSIRDELENRSNNRLMRGASKMADSFPLLSSLASVLTSVGSASEYVGNSVLYGRDVLLGKDAKFRTNENALITNSIRGTVSDKVDWTIGNWDAFDFLYGTVMSGVDSLTASMLPGSAGGFVLGLSAAAQGTNDALARGMSSGQAFWNGLFSGVFEGLFESFSIGNFQRLKEIPPESVKDIFFNLIKSMGVNASEEMATEIANIGYDTIVNGEFANYTPDELRDGAWKDALRQVLESGASGALMGLGMGGIGNAIGYSNMMEAKGKAMYGGYQSDLVDEALEIDPDNAYAARLQKYLANGNDISGKQLNKLAKQNEKAIRTLDEAAIQKGAAQRLTELGETGDVEILSGLLAKQAAGKSLSRSENQILAESNYGIRVSNELNAENIRSGDYSGQWAQKLDTNRINAAEYSKLVESAESRRETAEETITNLSRQPQTPATAALQAQDSTQTRQAAPTVATEEPNISQEQHALEETVSLEEASKKYGKQANAMMRTYQEGQDVVRFDNAYKMAYDMGYSGVSKDYAMRSEAIAYLTEGQREIAYSTGADASNEIANRLAAKNKASEKNTGGQWSKGEVLYDGQYRGKGTVKGVNVSMKDVMDTLKLSDPQKIAYRIFSNIAEATGINIVLYKSEAGEDGKFTATQGDFSRRDPGTIYIDLNAGLSSVKDISDMGKYMLLYTFSHEFLHFVEKWNPVQYNELRKTVFAEMNKNGNDADLLIRAKQEKGMNYDSASREVVAESLTEILPQASFVETLYNEHKSLFDRLLDKLRQFAADIKAYFSSVKSNSRNADAAALKSSLDGSLKYAESIVSLFDNVAKTAVENYQRSLAASETAKEDAAKAEEPVSGDPVMAEEPVSVDPVKAEEPVQAEAPVPSEEPYVSKNGYTITDNAEFGSIEVKFDSKPAREVLDKLKENGFRWHKKKGVWYGKSTRETIADVLDKVYEAERAPTEPAVEKTLGEELKEIIDNATGEERKEIIDAIIENNKGPEQMYPTEIRGERYAENPAKADNIKEEESNGEKTDNDGPVLQPVSDRQGDSRLLDGLQTEDVQGNVQGRDTVGSPAERGRETVRHDSGSDAQRDERGHGEGSSQSGDLRRDDGLTLHEEVAKQIEKKSTQQPKGSNFVIGDSLDLPSGEKSRYKANIDAIRLVKQLESEGRYATESEQIILSKYVGWGGIANAFNSHSPAWVNEYNELKGLLTDEEYRNARASTLNAFYTDIPVVKAMYDGLKQLGFSGGRLLEPSCGVGNFVGAMPADMSASVKSWTMVELDGISGLISKHLYPNADVRIQGFENAIIPNNYMDVAIGNVPFGDISVMDKAYPKSVTSSIHNYFFAKTLDKVRPGGIVMFITSSYTMNSRDNSVRRYIMQKADLLGAIRLPDTAFKGNAGTDVCADILILKKRADGTSYSGEDFLTSNYDGKYGSFVSTYFTNHPEMILGTPAVGGRYGSLTYKALEGDLGDHIREAFQHIQGKMEYAQQLSPERTNFAVERAEKKTKNSGFVSKEGKIYQNKDGNLTETAVSAKTAERIAGMLEVRDAARDLQNALQQGLKDSEIKKARTKLNKTYDSFIGKHGYLNDAANRRAFSGDPDAFMLLSLENYDPDKKTGAKADIFSTNTIAPNRTVITAKDVQEGLIVSVNQTGGVDSALIAKLTGKPETEVVNELLENRTVFKNRNGGLETAEVYLSGNVRAKLRDAEALALIDKSYQKNVEALKEVVPKDVPFQDIYVTPGAVWVPDSVYSDFAAQMLGTRNYEYNKSVEITRNPATGNYTVEIRNAYLKNSAANTQKWGVKQRSFIDLFDAMLNNKSVVIRYKDEDGKYIIDTDATAAANEKIENITNEFQQWLWKDEARKAELSYLYNETFNCMATPSYNGDHLTVNGANAQKPLRPHQRNAVQRIIASGGNTLLAHKVGAGKTYEMAAAAMKLRQLGLVKKPLFIVPKALVAQWGKEFMDFFPIAKILVSEESDFTPQNRRVFTNRIANGDYDAVIISYEQFEKLPISKDFERELSQEQLDEVIAALEESRLEKGQRSPSVKDLEKKRKSLEAKIASLKDVVKDEDNISFEQLGVDSLFVDEAHNFKNLFYTTNMSNVSGLSNSAGAKRAFDMYTKVRYLQKLNGGRGVVFATATPVMNSMAEMYIMQKYLQPDLLKRLGLSTFDAWAKQFGEVVNGVEIKPSGQGYRVKQSFSRFKNLAELQQLFRNFSDVLTDIPGLKIPKMKGGQVHVVVCQPSQFQKDYMLELEKRAENIKNVDPRIDNMLKITSDGRKISYTQRMIDPSMPYEEGCKIYQCADNVAAKYKESSDIRGTQLVFIDMATPKGKSKAEETVSGESGMDMENAKLYEDMKARMVKNGIPANEIAFIHDADTDAKKKKLFADVNDGKIRVLIGSTAKMGVGMNAQKRVVAIHHLDAPWRPGDVEQRNGRAFRQGNINEEVEDFTYVTEGSFDARLWDILDRKQSFINQIMNGDSVGREVEDTGEVTLSAAEVKALASGSPLIMEQVQLDTDIKKLESLRRAHTTAVHQAAYRLAEYRAKIPVIEKLISNGKEDLASRKNTYSEGKFAIKIGKTKLTDKKEAGILLMAEATAKANADDYTTIGEFAGFTLRVLKTAEGIKGQLLGKQAYPFSTYQNNTTYMINHLISVVDGLSERVSEWENALANAKNGISEQEQLMKQPFAKQAELDRKRARYNEVMAILNPKTEQNMSALSDTDDGTQYQNRDYLEEEQNYDGTGIQGVFATERRIFRSEVGEAAYAGENRGNGASGAGGKAFAGLGDSEKRRLNSSVKRVIYGSKNFSELRLIIASAYGKQAQDMTMKDWDSVYGSLTEGLYNDSQTLHPVLFEEKYTYLRSSLPSLLDAIRGDEQYQERTSPLSDREVLSIAASELGVQGLSPGEQDALHIFRERLTSLYELEQKRLEAGRLYREQQFGQNVDRQEAAKTLNRMKVLEDKIQKASLSVLDVEEKTVLKQVLQKARKVVEKQDREKATELLNRYRDRRNNAEAIKKYRNRLVKDVNALTDWVLNSGNKDIVKHIPAALKDSVIPFLSSISMMSKRSLNGGDPTIADNAFQNRLLGLQNALKKNSESDLPYSSYSDLPPDFSEKLEAFRQAVDKLVKENSGQYVINRMTSDELKELSQIVRTLKKVIENFNKFHNNAMFQHVFDAGDDTIAALSEMRDAGGLTGGISDFVFWKQIRPAYAFERFGDGGKAIYDEFRRGQAMMAFNTKRIIEFSQGAYTAEEVKAWEKELLTIQISEGTIRVPVSFAMSFYELSKRKQALGHILGSGVRVATFKLEGTKISDNGHRMTEEDVNAIVSKLTDRQKEVADSLQKFMQQQGGEWGNYVSMKRFGEKLFGEENYFPINSDGRYLPANADGNQENASLYALLNMGFTKSTQEKANNQIVLYSIFDVFSHHMASMAQYHAFALPVVDAIKWFNYQQKSEPDENGKSFVTASVRDQMDRVYGVPEEKKPGSGKQGYAQRFVINIIKAYNGTEAQGSPADTFFLNSLRRYNKAQVAFNFRVAIQQPMAITRAGLLLDYGSILKGLSLNPAAIKKNIAEMQEFSGIAAWKSLGFYDVNVSRGLTEMIKHSETIMDKAGEVGMWGAEKADTLTWAAIWSACKEEVIAKQGLAPKDDGFYEAVADLFEDVVYKTQVVDSVLTKNEFMRSKGFAARSISSFMSEAVTTAGMVADTVEKFSAEKKRGMTFQQVWNKNKRMIGRVFYVYAISAILNAAVQSIPDAFRDDDDYETILEKWMEAFKSNLTDEAMPFNKLPVLSDLYEVAKELASIFGGDTYGNPPNTVYMQWYDSLIKGTGILFDKIKGNKTNYTVYGGVYKLLQAASGAAGVPLATVTREAVTAWNSIIGRMAPGLKVRTYDPGEKGRIKYAYLDGYLTEEEATQELLKLNLDNLEDENDAYFVIRSWENEDGYSKFSGIYSAIRSGENLDSAMDELLSHGYTKKQILTQVKKKISEWVESGEITGQQANEMVQMVYKA